jgi:hypothetical protein
VIVLVAISVLGVHARKVLGMIILARDRFVMGFVASLALDIQ